ncbi:hypothetical protein BDA99DRAFT_558314 [Phascolomyces articulosus]|uniref:Uncharacterized protein n=1 Tax=Phascolomyces articulosus TaxID=60185 RepID=A0AAD5K3S0_9FUNG|nr:hypothetical protein BDA99DRAFT_558314 [Phascolomyces articulosus]
MLVEKHEETVILNKESPWSTGATAESSYGYHASVLVGSSIYYIGGINVTPQGDYDGYVSIRSIRTFDTETGQWSTRPVGGSVFPSTRVQHTVTLKPSTGEIILFGGDYAEDYIYTLNTRGGDLSWSNRTTTIQSLGGSFSPIYIIGHADQWAWVASVNAIKPQPLHSTTSNDGSSGQINAGTIAGVVKKHLQDTKLEYKGIEEEEDHGRGSTERQNDVKPSGDSNPQPRAQSSSPPLPPSPDLGDQEWKNDNNNIKQSLSSKTADQYTQNEEEEDSKKIELLSADYTNEPPTLQVQPPPSTTRSSPQASEKPVGGVPRDSFTSVKPDGA